MHQSLPLISAKSWKTKLILTGRRAIMAHVSRPTQSSLELLVTDLAPAMHLNGFTCNQSHMYWLTNGLDTTFFDRFACDCRQQLGSSAVSDSLRPWRWLPRVREARYCEIQYKRRLVFENAVRICVPIAVLMLKECGFSLFPIESFVDSACE